MLEIDALDPDTTLAALLVRVESGEEIVLTRKGRPVARLVPSPPAFDREAARKAAGEIWAMGKTATLGEDLTVKQLIEDGRRY